MSYHHSTAPEFYIAPAGRGLSYHTSTPGTSHYAAPVAGEEADRAIADGKAQIEQAAALRATLNRMETLMTPMIFTMLAIYENYGQRELQAEQEAHAAVQFGELQRLERIHAAQLRALLGVPLLLAPHDAMMTSDHDKRAQTHATLKKLQEIMDKVAYMFWVDVSLMGLLEQWVQKRQELRFVREPSKNVRESLEYGLVLLDEEIRLKRVTLRNTDGERAVLMQQLMALYATAQENERVYVESRSRPPI